MAYRRRFYKRRPRRYLRRRTYRKYGRKGGLRRMVKRIVDRKLETKQYSSVVMNQTNTLQQSAGGIATNTAYIIPSISQGAADGQRIGDRIDVKSLRFKMHIHSTVTTFIGVVCRVIIFSLKDYQQDTAISLPSIEYSNFFRSGTGTATANGYLGNDVLLPINKNRIIVHHERIVSLGAPIYGATLVTQAPTSSPSLPGHKFLSFNMNKALKMWKYDENGVNPNLPLNHNLWCCVLVNNADNTLGGGASQLTVNGVIDIHYKDA